MNAKMFDRISCVFREATWLQEPQRAAYLDQACAGDSDLRAEVESLLEHDSVFNEPAFDSAGPPTSSQIALASARPVRDTPPPAVPDYELFRKIGSGGQGEVWVGRNRLDRQYYAVKVFPRQAVAEMRGLREYKASVREHPRLLRIEHVGEAGDLCYYIMPLADDARGALPVGDLDRYEALTLSRYLDRRGRLDIGEILAIGGDILEAIGYLHTQGCRHGDVKPGNILKVNGRWQLGDHGLVSNAESREAMGCTPAYCPPEGPDDRTADLYALGVTLFEIGSGEKPGRIADLVESRLTLPGDDPRSGDLEAFLRRSCAREPANRFGSARDMQEALKGIAGKGRDSGTPRRVFRALLIAAMVVLAAGAAMGILSPWRGGAAPAPGPVAPVEVRTLSLEHYRGMDALGWIDLGTTTAREDDSVKIRVELSEPAYCFVLALNPNGTVNRCYPHDDDARPELLQSFDAPVQPDKQPGAYGLTDGPGAQAFVVVASREPLPSYGRWRTQLATTLWQHFEVEGVWEYDGHRLEARGGTRGEIRADPASHQPFTAAIDTLRAAPGVQAIKSILFPVRPSNNEPRPDTRESEGAPR